MKNILKSLFVVLCTLGLVACDPHEDKVKDLGSVVAKNDIKVAITEDTKVPNLYHFELTTPAILGGIFKCDDAGINYVGPQFSQRMLWAGDYAMEVQVYNKAGLSEIQTINFSVPQNDPAMYTDKNLMNLTGGDAGKIWVVASNTPAHLGVGPVDSRTPDWWSAGPGELSDKNFYDDELSFVLSKDYKYTLVTNGKIFVNESAAKTMAPAEYPDGSNVAIVANYVQPQGQKWNLITEGTKLYIQFSDKAFPSYVANPDALGGKYEITKLTETELQLRWAGSGLCWYYKFKVKQ